MSSRGSLGTINLGNLIGVDGHNFVCVGTESVDPCSDLKGLREPRSEGGDEHRGETGFRVLLLEGLGPKFPGGFGWIWLDWPCVFGEADGCQGWRLVVAVQNVGKEMSSIVVRDLS